MMARSAGESFDIRPRRTCGSSFGMGSERCNSGSARLRKSCGLSTSRTRTLSGLRPAVGAVTIRADKGPVVEGHRLITDRTVRHLDPQECSENIQVQFVVVFV